MLVGGGTSEGIDVIFDNDEASWSPSLTTLPLPNDLGEGQLILEIDLGQYQMITGFKIVNGDPGITLFLLSGTKLSDNNEEVLLEETKMSDGEQKQFELKKSKLLKYLKLTLSFKHKDQVAWSSLKYIEFLPSPEEFQIKQKSSKSVLGSSSKDNLLFLYPYNCRTYNLTRWSCKNGQLYNNEIPLKFMNKVAFLALTDRGIVTTPSSTKLVPTFREEAGLKSSKIYVEDDYLRIEIDSQEYIFKPREFPKHSFLSAVYLYGLSISNKIEFVKQGFLSLFLLYSRTNFTNLDNRFAFTEDQTRCFEFPETNGDCGTNGCNNKKGTELCKDLDGYPADSSAVLKNEKMVRKFINWL